MPTTAQALAAHGIQNDIASLTRSLTSKDPVNRGLAALGLADLKATQTSGAIKASYQRETDQQARLSMAFALSQLNPESGVPALISIATSSALVPYRLEAIRHLHEVGAHNADVVLPSLWRSGSDSQSRAAVLELMSTGDLDKGLRAEMIRSETEAIRNPDPYLRLAAATALARNQDEESQSIIAARLAVETEPTVRARLSNVLNK